MHTDKILNRLCGDADLCCGVLQRAFLGIVESFLKI